MGEECSYYHGSYGPHDYGEYESGYAVNEVDIIFERSEDGTELGLTIRGTDYGPSAISRILEAIAIHDINTVDPLQGMPACLPSPPTTTGAHCPSQWGPQTGCGISESTTPARRLRSSIPTALRCCVGLSMHPTRKN